MSVEVRLPVVELQLLSLRHSDPVVLEGGFGAGAGLSNVLANQLGVLTVAEVLRVDDLVVHAPAEAVDGGSDLSRRPLGETLQVPCVVFDDIEPVLGQQELADLLMVDIVGAVWVQAVHVVDVREIHGYLIRKGAMSVSSKLVGLRTCSWTAFRRLRVSLMMCSGTE